MSETEAVMIVGDWNTKCSHCGDNVAVEEERHDTVLCGYPATRAKNGVGCHALFVGMRPALTASIQPGRRSCGHVANVRPDLPVVESEVDPVSALVAARKGTG